MENTLMPEIKISESTPVSLKLVCALIAGFFSACAMLVTVVTFANSVDAKATTANSRLDGMELRSERYLNVLGRVDRRLSRIEGALHIPIINPQIDEDSK